MHNFLNEKKVAATTLRSFSDFQRSYIATKIDFIDPDTSQVITQAVEVIFKKYSINEQGANENPYENPYVTAPQNTGSNSNSYHSGLYASSRMTPDQMSMVGQLLDSETVRHSYKNYNMRLAERFEGIQSK